eukprot:906098-Pyramimonas_sp.AAC.2
MPLRTALPAKNMMRHWALLAFVTCLSISTSSAQDPSVPLRPTSAMLAGGKVRVEWAVDNTHVELT